MVQCLALFDGGGRAEGLPFSRPASHTAITEMAEARAPDATLMAITGHLTREMLEHYSHVRMEAKRDAVDKLSSGLMGKPLIVADDLAQKVS